MHLLQLAPELLTLIFEQLVRLTCVALSPTSLSLGHGTISHNQYTSLVSTFLHSYLSSRDLERLPHAQCPLSKLIQSNTTRLSLRLVGHPSKQVAKRPWHAAQFSNDDENYDNNLGKLRDDWTTAVPLINNDGTKCDWTVEERQLLAWRKRVNNKLAELAGWLPATEGLEELCFEASSEYAAAAGPRWDYITGGSVASLISSLPSSLINLTLDTSGSTIVTSKDDRKPAHLCHLVGGRIHDFQHVRLRMRHICPDIFRTLAASATASTLRSLVIRLSLPSFPPATFKCRDEWSRFDAQPCNADGAPLHKAMIDAGAVFVRGNPSIKELRISFREAGYWGWKLMVADCVDRRFMYDPYEMYYHLDDGRKWGTWEENCQEPAGSF